MRKLLTVASLEQNLLFASSLSSKLGTSITYSSSSGHTAPSMASHELLVALSAIAAFEFGSKRRVFCVG